METVRTELWLSLPSLMLPNQKSNAPQRLASCVFFSFARYRQGCRTMEWKSFAEVTAVLREDKLHLWGYELEEK